MKLLFKPHTTKASWTEKHRRKVWISYTIFCFIFSIFLLIAAIIYYNEVYNFNRESGYIFYLILGILYLITGIGLFFLVLTLNSIIKMRKKNLSPYHIYKEYFLELEGMINYYLKKNEGKLYKSNTLISLLENSIKNLREREYFIKNVKEILDIMEQRGTIKSDQKNHETYYSV